MPYIIWKKLSSVIYHLMTNTLQMWMCLEWISCRIICFHYPWTMTRNLFNWLVWNKNHLYNPKELQDDLDGNIRGIDTTLWYQLQDCSIESLKKKVFCNFSGSTITLFMWRKIDTSGTLALNVCSASCSIYFKTKSVKRGRTVVLVRSSVVGSFLTTDLRQDKNWSPKEWFHLIFWKI